MSLERARKRKWISPRERELYRELLRVRDGAFCRLCKRSEQEYELEIDHINGDPNDWRPENLRFLCKSCNQKERRRMEREAAQAFRVESVCARENMLGADGDGGRVERRVDFALSLPAASAELKLNRDKEPWFRREVMHDVMANNFMTIKDALDAVAEKIGASQVTCRRYLLKMTSKYGPLVIDETNQGTKILRLNPSYWVLGENRKSGSGEEERKS